jgi:hypothetical protein
MEKILELLGLPKEATQDEACKAIKALQTKPAPAAVESDEGKMEKRIRAKIAESGGALNRDQARMAIEHQDKAAADAKKKK